ncbi:unnamed protein product, partial [Allacma fusca]
LMKFHHKRLDVRGPRGEAYTPDHPTILQ